MHYRTPLDIVAIKFKCCDAYYPCHLCHDSHAGHDTVRWPVAEHDRHAILCGACGSELTIAEYVAVVRCPACDAPFNERCRLHHDLYFETR
ncbi:hypothetical protein Asi03nite_45220 [Actinoplanes siamensis]|uniref:CHY-type domain-containing protein n=1 Tax=Actinoplanes siamensis TaxID=1223317 RepID=A0A919TLZ2_9ACTN|nr:hypothetical protein Asi03nite_45220 [Actinoplanes siamensis]